jgi:hypothetical protein
LMSRRPHLGVVRWPACETDTLEWG